MKFSVRKKALSPIELEYADLKKQSAVESIKSKPGNGLKFSQLSGIKDDLILSLTSIAAENQSRKRPSQPVTLDEKQALSTRIPIHA